MLSLYYTSNVITFVEHTWEKKKQLCTNRTSTRVCRSLRVSKAVSPYVNFSCMAAAFAKLKCTTSHRTWPMTPVRPEQYVIKHAVVEFLNVSKSPEFPVSTLPFCCSWLTASLNVKFSSSSHFGSSCCYLLLCINRKCLLLLHLHTWHKPLSGDMFLVICLILFLTKENNIWFLFL